MTDFRALCAELLQPLAEIAAADPHHANLDLVTRARLALTHPVEPQGPTDEDLWELYDDMGGDPEDCAWCSTYARAVLARWGS